MSRFQICQNLTYFRDHWKGTGTLKKAMTLKEKGMSQESRQKILKTLEVLRGKFFDLFVAGMPGMRKLLN